MSRRIHAFLCSLVGVVLIATPASAIIGGRPTGASYGNVGLLLADGFPQCTATLIAPNVVISAAHCVGSPGDRRDVTFAPTVTFGDDGRAVGAATVSGSTQLDPRYLDAVRHGGAKAFIDQSTHDLGVVLLDHPAADVFAGISPAPLPTLGLLDGVARMARAKDSDALTTVGYGSAGAPRGNPHDMYFDGARRMATGPMTKLDPLLLYLRTTVNAAWSQGGPCYGDSGGPSFLGASTTIVSVHSFGMDPLCQNLGGSVRLDTASARSFLDDFVAVP